MSKHANISDKTWKRIAFWNLASQTQRYPGGGNFPMPMTRSFIPLMEEVYGDRPELIVEKEMRYLNEYCNTENTAGGLMLGAMFAVEASGVENASDISNALKVSLMGPLAGIGDSIFKVGGKVIFSAMAGYMALEGSLLGLFICCLWMAVTIAARYWFFVVGYDQGANFITNMADQLNLVTSTISVLGLVVIGNCIPSTVKLTTSYVLHYGESTRPLQSLIDMIFPYLLPCLFTFGIYKLLAVKGMTTVKIVYLVLIAGVVLSFLGLV